MNYMADVAKMLGVELGERFRLYDDFYDYKFDYYLTQEGIVHDDEKHKCDRSEVLVCILCGKYRIKRKPWKPQYGEKYYRVNGTGYIREEQWYNDCIDIIYYKLGNCYKCRSQAEENIDKWASFYASDEVLEV